MADKCVECKYYNSDDETCRRYPPIVRLSNPAGVGNDTMCPVVKWNWFCGEWKVKE